MSGDGVGGGGGSSDEASGDGLRLRGGAGGTAVAVEDLRSAAGVLDRAGADLALVGARLPARLANPALAVSVVTCPAAAAAVADAAARCLGPRGPSAVAAGLVGTAAGVRAAAAGYASAEEVAAAHVAAAGWLAGRTGAWLPAAVVLASLSITATGDGAAAAVARRMLGSHAGAHGVGLAVEALPPTLLGLAGRPPAAGSVPAVSKGVLVVARPVGPLREGGVRLAVPTLTVAEPARAPRGVADLLATTERIAATGAIGADGRRPDPGTVRVTRVQRPAAGGGTRTAWIVHVPGTQSWTAEPQPGDTPFDLSGNVGLMAGTRTAGTAAVTAALDTAGVPSDEPVLLVGHSQGGLVAAALAADTALRRRVSITHVVTAGSPVATVAVPDDVRVLSLEHEDDLVPRLDGRLNPDRRTWLTVVAAAPSEAAGSLPPHDSTGYVATASTVDRSQDPDLRDHRRSMAPFLDGPGVSVDSTDVRAVRGAG